MGETEGADAVDSDKMVRETLCVAQMAVGLLPDDYRAGRTKDEHIAQLQRLINALPAEGTITVPDSLDWTDSGPVQRMVTEERALAAEAEVARLTQALERVRAAVAQHPDPCPEVDTEAGITCGWKRAYTDVVAALEESTDGR